MLRRPNLFANGSLILDPDLDVAAIGCTIFRSQFFGLYRSPICISIFGYSSTAVIIIHCLSASARYYWALLLRKDPDSFRWYGWARGYPMPRYWNRPPNRNMGNRRCMTHGRTAQDLLMTCFLNSMAGAYESPVSIYSKITTGLVF